ncbi:hypothetical protein SAMN02927921_04267 [Sinomicrobium oceani]|uniref:Uncharacterized protein n=1 Tax=Sinomicrobium oceani TaxID=1150368 RepID=A0A1K1S0C6_9FLAO|nr:type VI-B CRISPR-associated RNA-guided ribonuclease Cas13b [Sinomicrobium oceani]SFW77766.1 hypothetical protein SAMN02927921_04267 [Sinomicrobium oceani]
MESTTTLGLHLKYQHDLFEDKHYFGGGVNLAVQNIESIFQAFAERYGIQNPLRKNGVPAINNIFHDNISISNYKEYLKFLKQYLPVVGFLEKSNEINIFEFREDFEILINAIYKLRHFYTHYYHSPIKLEDRFYTCLNELFVAVAIQVKKHKMKSDKTRQLLNKNLHQLLQQLIEQKREKLKDKKAEGEKVSLDTKSIENAVLNDAFVHLLDKDENIRLNYSSRLSEDIITKNGITLSISGLLFLLSLFLQRKEAEDLRSRIEGFKGKGNELRFMATHWVFSYLNVKRIKHRLNTDFQKETLLIQIADELSKVPDEVYKTLDHENRSKFLEDINEYIREGNEDASLNESTVVHGVIRKRYENKFHYLVLRYLDEFVDFPSLRFQVHLGNYIHDRRDKVIDGTNFITNRVIKEPIKVFGKLSHVSKLKSDYMESLSREHKNGWDVFPNPSYNFVGHNIPIFINLRSASSKGKELYRDLMKIKSEKKKKSREEGIPMERRDGKPTKIEISNQIDRNIKDNNFKDIYPGEPLAMLSLNELPALLFELLRRPSITPQDIEDRMVEKLYERFQIIRDYKPGDGLSTSKISKKLRKADNSTRLDGKKLLRAIQTETRNAREKLHTLEENKALQKNRKRRTVYTTREQGREASWLAQDLKRFMPIASRKEWRGYHHSQLQQILAFYDQNPKQPLELLEQFWDLKEDTYVWNSWIHKSLSQHNGFVPMYEGYLKGRLGYYKKLESDIIGFLEEHKVLKRYYTQQHLNVIFRERLYFIKTETKQKLELLARPLVFPRGIFDDKPTFVQDKKVVDHPELFADWYVYSYKDDHSFQEFYHYKRDYNEIFETELSWDIDFKDNKRQLNPSEQMDLFRMKWDLKIKKIKIQDIFLKIVAEDIYLKIFGHKIPLSLSDFYISRQERLTLDEQAVAQSMRLPGDTSENQIKESNLWQTTVPYEKEQIREPKIKLKDIGKFKYFLQQQKVLNLLKYDPQHVWTKAELEEELYIGKHSYEVVRREMLLQKCHQLEKHILEQFRFDGSNHPRELEQGNHPNFKMYIVNGILTKRGELEIEAENWWLELGNSKNSLDKVEVELLTMKTIPEQKAFLLILIRNKFAHNQLPADNYFHYASNLMNLKKSDTYSLFWFTVADTIVQEFMSL